MITKFVVWLNQHSPLLYLTQSLWRDESFAWLMARASAGEIIALSSKDFNPPLHYLLLHGWMILFGQSEIVLRSLSFLFFLILLIVVYRFTSHFISGRWQVIFTVLFALNPMLLYFAFEVRMYSLYALLATLSTYALYSRHWLLYVVSSVLGLYTHSFMPFTLFVHLIYVLLILTFRTRTNQSFPKGWQQSGEVRRFFYAMFVIGILYLPWLPILFSQWQRSSASWIYPADLQLVASSLGNLLIGYDGTPAGWWWATRIVSVFIIGFSFLALRRMFWQSFLFFLWVVLPLTIVLVISFFKPLFVNRYLIFITVAETFLLSLAFICIRKRWLRLLSLFLTLTLFLGVNTFHPPLKRKLDIRKVYQQLNQKAPTNAIILTDQLVYFDGIYYFTDPSRVFVYRPPKGHIPVYVGTAVIPSEKIVEQIPQGMPVYFVNRDGSVDYFPETLSLLGGE